MDSPTASAPPERLLSADRSSRKPRWQLWLGCSIVVLLTYLAAYRIPFHFPPPPAVSQSYAAGFNNKLALALLGGISLAVAIWTALRGWAAAHSSDDLADRAPMPLWVLLAWSAACVLWIGVISSAVFRVGSPSFEDFYFVPQLEKYFLYHKHLYREIEFAYGPLLFYFPVPIHWLLSPWKVSIEASYYVSLVINHLVGLGLLFFLVNALPVSRGTRLITFSAIALSAFNLLLGPNYTLLRFALPLASFVLLDRLQTRSVQLAWCALSTILQFAVSSEMGVAFVVGCLFYGTYRAFTINRKDILLIPAALAGAFLSIGIMGRDYFASMAHFSGGLNNKVIYPSIDSVIVLAAAMWFAPRLAGREIALRSPRAPLLCGLFVISISLLPAVFGVSDLVHNSSNGLGLLLLATVACSTRRLQRILWLTALTSLSIMYLVRVGLASFPRISPAIAMLDSSHVLYRTTRHLSNTMAAFLSAVPSTLPQVPLQLVEADTGHQRYEFPLSLPRFATRTLLVTPEYVPSYFEGTINAWGPDAQQIKIAEMRAVSWILAPTDLRPNQLPADVDEPYTRHIHFPTRHIVYTDDLIKQEIRDHWVLTAQYPAGIGLYRHK